MVSPAVAILSALLKQNNHEVKLFDTSYWEFPERQTVERDKNREKHLQVPACKEAQKPVSLHTTNVYDDFNKEINEFEPDLIACSATEDTFPYAIKLLENLHNKGKAKTILGGVFATFAPHKAIQYPEIDIVCLGEGEYPLVQLCDRIEKQQTYTDIPNLWIKQDGVIFKNRMTSLTDIDSLPLMDLEIFEDSRFYRPFDGKMYRTIPVETHRGCPYSCAYCNTPGRERLYKDENQRFSRLKSIENVHRELLFYKNHWQAEYLYFWADTFLALSNKYLEAFAEMYASEIGLPFWCQTRPETLTEKRVKLLKKMGVHRINLGIEHGNAQFRENYLSRKVANKIIVESIHRLSSYEIKFAVNNIVGLPAETRELAFDTIELNRQFVADGYNINIYIPYHGTSMRDMAEKMGYIDPDTIVSSWVQFSPLNMPQFSKEAIEGIRRCFVPYVFLEKDRWPEIKLAEKLTSEGDQLWNNIIEECRARFFSQFSEEDDD